MIYRAETAFTNAKCNNPRHTIKCPRIKETITHRDISRYNGRRSEITLIAKKSLYSKSVSFHL